MAYLAILLLVIAAGAAVLALSGRHHDGAGARGSAPEPAEPPRDTAQAAQAQARAMLTAAQMPRALTALTLLGHAQLPKARADALVARLRTIPRPSRILYPLLSNKLLESSRSSELADLMMDEPRIVARVLATVNSPSYGLPTPIGNIGQAVVYLGMNTVRSICQRQLLERSLRVADPQVRAIFDQLWRANACANELCFKLAHLLNLPQPGTLGTQVTLSHLGRLAAMTLLEPRESLELVAMDPVQRARAEQDRIGLCAAELGSLLMAAWEVPQSIIDEVRDVDRTLVTAFDPTAPEGGPGARAALCFLCNRLGEDIVWGRLADMTAFELAADPRDEMYCLRSWLDHPQLAPLPTLLRLPEVASAVARMAQSEQARAAAH